MTSLDASWDINDNALLRINNNSIEIDQYPGCEFTLADIGDKNADMSKVSDVSGAYLIDNKFVPYSDTIEYKYKIKEETSNAKAQFGSFKITAKTISAYHSHEYLSQIDPTCTEEGISERWYCPYCDKYYNSENAEMPTDIREFVIPATGHNATEKIVSSDAVAIPQTEDSPAEYYYTCKCGTVVPGDTFVNYDITDISNVIKKARDTIGGETSYSDKSVASLVKTIEEIENTDADADQETLKNAYETVINAILELKETKSVVILKSNIDAELSGGGNYIVGETVHLNAENKEDSIFEGWYLGNTKISTKNEYFYYISNEKNKEFTAHYLQYMTGIEPTCLEDGLKERWYCSICDKYYDTENVSPVTNMQNLVIDALGHDPTEKIVSPTALASAQTANSPAKYYYTCKCGDLVYDEMFEYFNITDIQNIINTARNYLNSEVSYSDTSSAALEAEISEAEKTDINSSQQTFENVYYSVRKAIDELKETEVYITTVSDKNAILSGSGKYICTEIAHLDAEILNDYTFEGWYIGETKISDSPVFDYLLSNSGNIQISAHYRQHLPYEAQNCTEDGVTERWYCSLCDKYYDSEESCEKNELSKYIIPANGHDPTEKTVSPKALASAQTENSPAKYYYTCKCGEVVAGDTFEIFDIKDIENIIANANAVISNGNYSIPSLSVLDNSVKNAESVQNDSSQETLSEAWYSVKNAIESLKSADVTVELSSAPEGSGILSGDGKYAVGETVHLSSENISGYTFEGWYIGETRISGDAVFDYVIENAGTLLITANYTENSRRTLSIIPGNGKVRYSYNSTEKTISNKLLKNFPEGTEFTLEAISDGEHQFLYWIDAQTNIIVSENESFSFTLSVNSNYEACYAVNSEDSDTHLVVFKDLDGEILLSDEIEHEESAEAPDHKEFKGMQFSKWDQDYNSIVKNTIISAKYVNESGYTVTVEGGTIENPKDTYSYQDLITVNAEDIVDEKEFTGWYIGDVLVSTDKRYRFYVFSDIDIRAVYNGKTEDDTVLSMILSDRTMSGEYQQVKFTSHWILPEKYKPVSGGLIRTYDPEAADDLLLENVDNTKIKMNTPAQIANDYTYDYTLTMAEQTAQKSVYVRGFIKYEDVTSGKILVKYTDTYVSEPLV